MQFRGVIVLSFLVAGCASGPAVYYKPTTPATALLRPSLQKIASANYRIFHIKQVDGMEVQPSDAPIPIDSGRHRIGLFMADRNGRGVGAFDFDFKAGDHYRFQAERKLSDASFGAAVAPILTGYSSLGTLVLADEKHPAAYELQLIDETDGHDTVASRRAIAVTDAHLAR